MGQENLFTLCHTALTYIVLLKSPLIMFNVYYY